MPENRAVLIFIAGPQKGERVSLPGGVLLAGRSSSANILLAEQYVSREQMRFQMTPEGWIVECASSQRIRINGKKFRIGQRILLDTGDTIGAGMSTEMLFVAPGDDATAALDAYLDHADGELKVAEVLPAEVLDDNGDLVETVETPTASLEEIAESDEPEDDLTDEEREELARQKKIRKYMIYGGIYAFILIAFVVVLKWLPSREVIVTGVPVLSAREIEDILLAKIDVGRHSQRQADIHVAEARALWDARQVRTGNIYKCVKKFRLAVAYSPAGVLIVPEHARIFGEAKEELVRLVTGTYKDAVVNAKAKNFQRSHMLFERLLKIVPAKAEPDPDQFNRLWDNVVDHINYVRGKLDTRGSDGGGFGM